MVDLVEKFVTFLEGAGSWVAPSVGMTQRSIVVVGSIDKDQLRQFLEGLQYSSEERPAMQWQQCESQLRALILEVLSGYETEDNLDLVSSHLADEIASFIYEHWGLEGDKK